MARFLETEAGKAFFRFKMALVRVRKTQNFDDDVQNDDHYQALQEMMEAEDRLMELSENERPASAHAPGPDGAVGRQCAGAEKGFLHQKDCGRAGAQAHAERPDGLAEG